MVAPIHVRMIYDEAREGRTPAVEAAERVAELTLEIFNHGVDAHGQLGEELGSGSLVRCAECLRLERELELAKTTETLASYGG